MNLPDECYEAWLKVYPEYIRVWNTQHSDYSNNSPHKNSSTDQVSSAQSTALTSCPFSILPINNVVAVQQSPLMELLNVPVAQRHKKPNTRNLCINKT